MKTLIALDPGLMARIEREVGIVSTEKRTPRVRVIRELLKEALDVRASARGEEIPTAEPVTL